MNSWKGGRLCAVVSKSIGGISFRLQGEGLRSLGEDEICRVDGITLWELVVLCLAGADFPSG